MRLNWKWILPALVVIGLLTSGGIRTYFQRKKALNQLQSKLENLREENKGLVVEIQRLKNDPHIIEQVARRDLGLIQPGEIEYRFVIENPSADSASTVPEALRRVPAAKKSEK